MNFICRWICWPNRQHKLSPPDPWVSKDDRSPSKYFNQKPYYEQNWDQQKDGYQRHSKIHKPLYATTNGPGIAPKVNGAFERRTVRIIQK